MSARSKKEFRELLKTLSPELLDQTLEVASSFIAASPSTPESLTEVWKNGGGNFFFESFFFLP
jgi:hypothetical protein